MSDAEKELGQAFQDIEDRLYGTGYEGALDIIRDRVAALTKERDALQFKYDEVRKMADKDIEKLRKERDELKVKLASAIAYGRKADLILGDRIRDLTALQERLENSPKLYGRYHSQMGNLLEATADLLEVDAWKLDCPWSPVKQVYAVPVEPKEEHAE